MGKKTDIGLIVALVVALIAAGVLATLYVLKGVTSCNSLSSSYTPIGVNPSSTGGSQMTLTVQVPSIDDPTKNVLPSVTGGSSPVPLNLQQGIQVNITYSGTDASGNPVKAVASQYFPQTTGPNSVNEYTLSIDVNDTIPKNLNAAASYTVYFSVNYFTTSINRSNSYSNPTATLVTSSS
jgi:hypothetical protein